MVGVSEIALIGAGFAALVGGGIWVARKTSAKLRKALWNSPSHGYDRIVVKVPKKEEITRHEYQVELAEGLSELRKSGVARRQWMNWMADEVYDHEATYVLPSGKELDSMFLPEVDEVYANDDGKWLEDFERTARLKPKTSERAINRLRLLSLAQRVWRERIRQQAA